MNVASDAIAVFDDDRVVSVSHVLAERLGESPAALIGESTATLRSRGVLDIASGLGVWRCLNREGSMTVWFLETPPDPTDEKFQDHLDRHRQATLYADVSLRLATASNQDLDQAIEGILQALAVAEGADRAYIIEFHDPKTGALEPNSNGSVTRLIRCTHEWCGDGIEAQISYVQDLSTTDFAWSFGTLLDRRVVHLPDVEAGPPEAEPERESFARYGVRSVLQVPMIMDGQVTGLVGFNAVNRTVRWPEETIRFLGGVCDALGTALTRVHARRAVEQAREAAEAANHAKSSFLSRMSHELRTPLNAVMGFTELLMTEQGRSESDQESLGAVYASAEHLLALVEDVLDISRVEAGGLPIELVPISVAEQVSTALRMIQVSGVRLSVPIHASHTRPEGETGEQQNDQHQVAGDPGATVLADARRLQQVIVNLVSNACKYNRPNGEVFVGWRYDDAMRWWEITVADTGEGIAPEAMHRIFEPFDRLGHEHGSIHGTGIGLTLTKMLVELMGGSILIRSTVGEGTLVTVRLRGAKPEPASASATR